MKPFAEFGAGLRTSIRNVEGPRTSKVTTVGLENQGEETILLDPKWELDPWKKGQLTKSMVVKEDTTVKTSEQHEGSHWKKFSNAFLFLPLESPDRPPIDQPKWQPESKGVR